MANPDISKNAFDPKKHYTGIIMQQGRVLLDDDVNSAEQIHADAQRQELIDIIGPYGTPDSGFLISNPSVNPDPAANSTIDFSIAAGTMYLGGLRLVVEEGGEKFQGQSDWLDQATSANLLDIQHELPKNLPADGQVDLVYLEAWQQPVTATEDSELLETALGGPDTTARVRNMARVKVFSSVQQQTCSDAFSQLNAAFKTANLGTLNPYLLQADTTLQVTFPVQNNSADDLCSPPVLGGYLGAENQAIRVQIVDQTTLTWGFDNASPVYRVSIGTDGVTVNFITYPKDQYSQPQKNQFVEILACSAELSNGENIAAQTGYFSAVLTGYNTVSNTIVLPAAVPSAYQVVAPAYIYLRLWNRGSDTTSPMKLPFTTGGAVALGQTGMAVTLSGVNVIPGDFWIIGARPNTPNVLVPWQLQKGMPPMGTKRLFAPLALIQWSINASITTGTVIHDCRKTFRPLTEIESCGCCSLSVGDGINSHGDFTSIADALANLPDAGGEICVMAGIHKVNVSILGKTNITITGCGEESILVPDTNLQGPLFEIADSQYIKLSRLTLAALGTTAIVCTFSDNITINNNRIIACGYGIFIGGIASQKQWYSGISSNIYIIDNLIGISDPAAGSSTSAQANTGIYSLADNVLIERNRIVVIPPSDGANKADPRIAMGITGSPDPCGNADTIIETPISLQQTILSLFIYVENYVADTFTYNYQVQGGVHIGNTSENVTIAGNSIIGGAANGITLGDADTFFASPVQETLIKANDDAAVPGGNTIYNVTIRDNYIARMGLSGIGVTSFPEITSDPVTLKISAMNSPVFSTAGLSILNNEITLCARQLPVESGLNVDYTAFGGIGLASCEDAIIRGNKITDNGIDYINPVCGIFIIFSEQIEISNNYILDNGSRSISAFTTYQKGRRGGIVLLMATQPSARNNSPSIKAAGTGCPAVNIFNNVVDQPVGQALFVIGLGQFSVVNNQFTSRSVGKDNVYSIYGTTVFILNLGLTKDLLPMIMTTMADFSHAAVNLTWATISGVSTFFTQFTDTYYASFPTGKVQFTNNQVLMDMSNPLTSENVSVCPVSIATLDDIAFHNNQSDYSNVPLTGSKTVVKVNTLLLGLSIRANGNRLNDGTNSISLLASAYMSTAIGNQSTHSIYVGGGVAVYTINSNNINLF